MIWVVILTGVTGTDSVFGPFLDQADAEAYAESIDLEDFEDVIALPVKTPSAQMRSRRNRR